MQVDISFIQERTATVACWLCSKPLQLRRDGRWRTLAHARPHRCRWSQEYAYGGNAKPIPLLLIE